MRLTTRHKKLPPEEAVHFCTPRMGPMWKLFKKLWKTTKGLMYGTSGTNKARRLLQSQRACAREMLFSLSLIRNSGYVPAVLYLLTAWAILAPIGDLGVSDMGTVIHTTLTSLLNSPLAVFWVVTVFLGFWLFTDTHVQWYRWIAGTVHG